MRRRLVLAFAYVLCAVILALTLPLALNLRERATAELLGSATVTAQSVAAAFDLDAMADPAVLRGRTTRFAREIDGRVIVIDDEGIVLADANPFPEPATSAVGSRYATPQRPEVSTALVGGRADAVVRESRELETDLLLASAPIVDDPRGPIEVVGAVRITLDVERVSEAVGRATWAVVAIGLASLVAGLIVALALARTLTRPLTKLAAAVRRLGSGDLTARADLHVGPPEVDELGRTFDEMAARVQRSMHAQQAFVANASHQLRTPLTAVKLRIEQAEGRVDDPEVHGILDDADRDIDRLSTTVDRMLRLAREIEEGPDVSADLVSAAHAARERWRPVASAVDANVTVDDVGPVFVRADRDDLDQLLDVVIENAVSHGGREVELRAEPGVDTSKLRVVDDGPGIPPDERDAVFQRFARGSATTAAGSGLGLTIARDLVERRGGTISIEGAEQRGTTIVVELPSSPPHP